MTMLELGRQARAAARQLALAPTQQKNAALIAMATGLQTQASTILAANAADVADARAAGLSAAMVDRLLLNESRLAGMAADLQSVAQLPDPVGEVFEAGEMPNGLHVEKRRVPLGVLGIIYEARPNVTMDAAGLAVKTGNAAILRGGSETLRSNQELVAVVQQGLGSAGLPEAAVQYVQDADRARVLELLQMADFVDLIIPRGGAGLHAFCRAQSRIPVMTGGIGICHLYVDEFADLDRSLPVIFNAKVQRPTVCNALDTVLVHAAVAAQFLPRVVAHLAPAGVTFRAHPTALPWLQPLPETVLPAGPQDFDTEWLSLVLGLKVVANLEEALAHIAAQSTAHSDGILTQNASQAAHFAAQVDSAAVYVNASTRFTDGSQLGLGAEVAISTQRLHARGPMGLRELTSYKWVIQGDYQVRL